MKKEPDTFSLIETLLWEKGSFFLLDLHLARLKKSASFFSFPFREKDLVELLSGKAVSFKPEKRYKTRVLLSAEGKTSVTSGIIAGSDGRNTYKAAISGKKVDRNDVFLAHKTTNRGLYDSEFKRFRKKGFYDVLFLNSEGEITEGTFTNLILRQGNDWWTPPLCSGVLPGTFREYLLKTKEIPVKEKALMKEDLVKANEIILINSVRKKIPVTLCV